MTTELNAKDRAILNALIARPDNSASADQLFRIMPDEYLAGGRPALIKSLEKLKKRGYLMRTEWKNVIFPVVEYRISGTLKPDPGS